MATLISCKQQLASQYASNPSSASSISVFMGKARGSDRTACMEAFNYKISTIKSYITQLKNQNSGGAAGAYNLNTRTSKSQRETTQTTTTSQTGNESEGFLAKAESIGFKILRGVIAIFVLILLRKSFKYLFEFIYDVLNAQRLVYMKVVQTRGDSKTDKEMQKELAKDMKEKIGRMIQVYKNLHELGQLGVVDSIFQFLFKKPKIVLIYSYEKGLMSFVIGVYPEYRSIVEGAISAQFSNSSMEIINKPTYFSKKHSDILPIETKKEAAYSIRTFKHTVDDPINNILDAMGKISGYDTAHIVMPIKIAGREENKRIQKVVDAMYRKDKRALNSNKRRHYFLMPWKIIDFFINGPSKELVYNNEDGTTGDKMVRMVKSQEDTFNLMGQEANLPLFHGGILLITSSDESQARCKENMDLMLTAYSVFDDGYGNTLDAATNRADLLGFIFKPLRSFAANLGMPYFFYANSTFGCHALTSLYHLPDGRYNFSPAISWMEYKVLPGPNNLPIMKETTGFIMSGIVAESYQKGKLSNILANSPHRAVGSKSVKSDKREPADHLSAAELEGKEIKEEDGKKFIKVSTNKTVRGYNIYKGGVLLGVNIYRNKFSPVYFQRDDRTRHHYCIGKSGTGKSVYLQSIARQDVRNGDGMCIIDPHGDLAEDMMEYIPKDRIKDVVFFDAGNEDRPMGMNLYEIESIDEADRTVNDATEMFIKMFGAEIFGPRIQEYFKFGSLTILEDFEDRPTLLDVPRLFTDPTYQEFKSKKVQNPVVRSFREKTFASMGDREKKEIIPYFTSKFVSFNTNRLIRNIIGQTKSAFKMPDIMDNQKILLISLSKGKIGDMNAQLLGMIIVSKIYTAAMARAKIPQNERKDFYLYVDEFQNFVSATFADILSEARKYRLSLTMAHQYIKQLESGKQGEGGKGDVKAAVFGNCGTIQSFKVGAPDAETLEKEYAPVLSQQDIIGISNYKAYIKLNINNTTSRVFSMNAIFTQDYRSKKIAGILKQYSAKKYGRKRKFVDAEIEARLGVGGGAVDEAAAPSPAGG